MQKLQEIILTAWEDRSLLQSMETQQAIREVVSLVVR
jgi:hypothetical protein